MHKVRLITLLGFFMALSAKSVFAQDRINLYADINRTTCAISEAVSPPIVYVHVWLTGPVVARAARFTVPKPACWVGATWIGDTVNPIHTGVSDSQRDWNVVFNTSHYECTAANIPPIYIGTVNFFVTGQSLSCCEIRPMPGFTYEFIDCDFGSRSLVDGGQIAIVNANASCPCQLPVATEPSTWGRVKSLYR